MARDDTAPEKKKLDLSVAQIAGSSLATVAAALLASKLGVYGTILGAGVVSVVATAGGPVIQHVFRRTGDRLRTGDLPRLGARAGCGPSGPPVEGEYGEATVHGTRVRGRKRTAVASAAAFVIAIGGLGAYEAAAGTSISDGGGTLLSGGTRKAADHRRPDPPRGEERNGAGGDGDGGNGGAATPGPGRSAGDGSPAPDPTPSRSPDRTPTPPPGPVAPTPKPTPPETPTPTPTPPTPGPSTPSPS
ncbi:hypothetical protein [Streptomyces sp. NPDC058279]|uniref:hypothetical protein n=1 Tax=Streptomyces sp. NPDC058279 TaxID=3346418 RepID=UPI0036E4DDB5